MNLELKKKIILVTVVVEALAIALFIKDYLDAKDFDGVIKRPPPGGVIQNHNLYVESENGQQEVVVSVSPMARSPSEKQELIEAAKSEIDETFFGKNDSPEEVIYDLEPKDSYCNETVKATWKFDNLNVLDHTGRLKLDNITEETAVRAYANLTCDDTQETYTFTFMIKVPGADSSVGYNYLLNKELKEEDLSSINTQSFNLPGRTGDLNLSWTEKKNYRGIQMALIGVFIPFFLIVASKEDEKKQKKDREKMLEEDYPDIVSALSLYVGAGVSVKGAFLRIASGYRAKLREGAELRPGYQAISNLSRQMEEGKGELESYKEFGNCVGHKDYRKLSILILQNIRKGSAHLTEQLEKEEHQAFEERKIKARILGEEASTKLLIPMMGLLAIVMIVLIVPAVMGMGI